VLGVPGQRWRTLLMIVAAIAVGLRVAPTAARGGALATGTLVVVIGVALLAPSARFASR
jgi:hypothetical protein